MKPKFQSILLLAIFSFSIVVSAICQDSTSHTPTSNETIQIHVQIDSIGAPVVIENDTIFFLMHGMGSASVKKRAEILSAKLTEIAEKFNPDKDSITTYTEQNFVDIVWREQVLLQVTELEAKLHHRTLKQLSSKWRTLIDQYYKKRLSEKETLSQYIISVAIIFATLFIINFILKRLFKQLIRFVRTKQTKYLKGIRIKDFEIMDAHDEMELILKAVFVIRLFFMLIFAMIVFPIIFSFFPVTKPITYKLIGLVSDPAINFFKAVVEYIPNLITILVIVYIVRTILKYLKLAARRIETGRLKIAGFYPDWSKTTYELIRIVVVALSFVMVFPYLPGAQSEVFKGVSVFIGIIFSIGSTSVVGNLVAGLVLTYMRPFKIGDRIKIGEIEGEIVEKTAFVLRIKTPKNEYITLPNSNVMSAHIVNYNRSFAEGGVILFTDITIGYDVPWRQVHELLLQAAEKTEYLEKDPKPFVLQNSLDDFSVAYQINAYSKKPLYKDLIYSLLHQNIQDIFNENGIEIMSPSFVASRNGNEPTIPAEYLKRNALKKEDVEDGDTKDDDHSDSDDTDEGDAEDR